MITLYFFYLYFMTATIAVLITTIIIKIVIIIIIIIIIILIFNTTILITTDLNITNIIELSVQLHVILKGRTDTRAGITTGQYYECIQKILDLENDKRYVRSVI